MGNVCCKRQITKPKKRSTELQFDHIIRKSELNSNDVQEPERQKVDTTNNPDLSLNESLKEDKNNNLELYLDDVYRKECVIKASQEEINFIQTGIETLVQEIFDLVIGYHLEHCELKASKEKTPSSSISKVGSFYEETKNNFPGEFDFILYFYTEKDYDFLSCADGHIETVTTAHKEYLKYVCSNATLNVTRSLYFDQYVRKHGPASMLRFIYNNGTGEEKYIHVDLVPGIKYDTAGNETSWFEENFSDHFKENFKSLRAEVNFPTKNISVVLDEASFTETEVHFMRNILSKKHVKVYRILKFLINGHGDDGILEEFQLLLYMKGVFKESFPEFEGKGYSSYRIKNMMLNHHDECRNPDEETIGDCVIQILEEMCQYSHTHEFPVVSLMYYSSNDPFIFLPKLKKLLVGLKSIQTSKDSYEYERIKMKPVSKHYLEILKKKVKRNALWLRYLDTLGGADPCYYSLMKFSTDDSDLWWLNSRSGRLKSIKTSEAIYEYERIRMKSKHYLDTLERNDSSNVEWFRYLDTLGGADPSLESFMIFFLVWLGQAYLCYIDDSKLFSQEVYTALKC